jgi:hypothetical protein
MAIDHDQVREAVMSLGLVGDEKRGQLRRFGVILNVNPVPFLVGREVDFINTLGPQARNLSEKVLIDAAQWCANATFGGIMASQEWAALLTPQIHNVQDRFDGLVAITNCLGWGKITDYKLNENAGELEFTVRESYYVDYWLDKYGKSERPVCYMWTGVAGGYLDLLLGSKVHEFTGEEVHCGARDGGEYCTFKARKIKRKFGL